ncbi:MAG: tRNA pseudouridine(38-40) synthase TruA [Betaproteobacteria bacterium]|nr:tRNA pseudouridine(38-40) synthase TruA [Betaproteobacteria bacterium]
MRIALGIEYNGSGFCGWQTQPAGCAVQDHLERAAAQIAGVPVATICAGRTDAGVHALAQVVHFDCDIERPASAWVRGVNALVPPALAVTWARVVADEFHARFAARARHYRYVLLNHAVRPAADYARVGWYHAPLDLEAMRAAAACLLGEHDFSAFRSSECQAKSPVRQLTRLDIERAGPYLVFDFCANGFLHHMVRNIIGSLIYVGNGRHESAWMAALLQARERRLAAPTFDAAGLYLTGVDYDARWGLPARERVQSPVLALQTAS